MNPIVNIVNRYHRAKRWLIFIAVLVVLILITIGYMIGYSAVDKSCIAQPFIYGINMLNEINDAEFICSCNGYKKDSITQMKPFTFNANGLIE